MRNRLLLALAVLFSGLWLALGTTRDRFPLPTVDRAGLLIRTVRHGAIQLPPEGGKLSPSRAAAVRGRIENANYIERGAFNRGNAEVGVFRLDPDGKTATQVSVRFGVLTSDLIEIKEGLREGDKVIVSDMSRWSNVDRIEIE